MRASSPPALPYARLPAALLAAGMLLFASACMVHKVPAKVDPPVAAPPAFSQTGPEPAPDKWWESFQDPGLNALVEKTLADNLDLQASWARLEQARALAKEAGADLYPHAEAVASASRFQNVLDVGPFGRLTQRQNLFTIGAVANYEVDLWGRLRSQSQAGKLSMQASREDVDALAVTLAATAGELWFALVEQRAQQALLLQQVEAGKTFLELVDLRFRQGQASALDVYQQRQQLSALQAQEPLVASNLELIQHQLAVLTGQPPLTPAAGARAALPDPPPLPATGLPADLLSRRPDVRALHLRVRAQDYQLGVAVANRLPALRLTAGAQYQGNEFTNIFRDILWNVAAGVTAPVFEGGRLVAEVDRNRAALKELTLAYGQSILNACREVEDALTLERQQRAYLAALEKELADARATREQARSRYTGGMTDYTAVLLALQSEQQVERVCLRAHKDLISYRVQLYRALGGSWSPGSQSRQ